MRMSQPVALSKRRRIHNDDPEDEHKRRIDVIHHESHFNFIKIYLLGHFSDHIRQFGNIPIYSTKFRGLAY